MLQTLLLRHVQRHEKLRIDLDPCCTTLVGPTDCGKTACIRALRWLAFNRPLGDALVRRGSDWCRAEAVFDDVGRVKREKAGGENVYRLNDQEYHSFGSEVPEPVAQVLNLGDVNFAFQHDASYLLSLSAPQAAKELNAVVNLEEIDRVLADAASAVRRAKATVDVSRARLADAEQRQAELSWVPEALAGWREVEGLQEELRQKQDRADRLATIIEGIEERQRAADGLDGIEDAWRRVVEEYQEWGDALRRCLVLDGLLERIAKAEGRACELDDEATKAEAELAAKTKGRCPVCKGPLAGS